MYFKSLILSDYFKFFKMPSHLVSSSVCPSESRGKTCHESSPGAGSTKSQGSGELSQGGSLSRGGRMRAVLLELVSHEKKAVGKSSQGQKSRRSPAGSALAEAQANSSKGQGQYSRD